MKKIVVLGTMIITLSTTTVYAGERLSLGYIYSASKSHTEIIQETQNSVNVVSPTTFDLKLDGTLEINEIADEDFVKNMHEIGIKVTPFLSNHWGRIRAEAALDNPDKLIEQLVEAIQIYDYDGVNVDLENLSVSYKDKLTEFTRCLRNVLPRDKTLSIAVAVNPERLKSTWVAAYDYKALAEYADYLVLMAYDEHSYGGAKGPVASIGFVEKSLQVVLEEVSKDKVLLGIPLYGRLWKEGEDVGGEAIIIAQMPRIINQYEVVPIYDLDIQTPQITLTVEEGEKGPYVNGIYLEEGTYTFYYENENSIKAKLQLVNEYDILGTALWALDNEGPDFWEYFKDALNAVPYESEKEIRLREKYEYAVQNLVGQPELPMIAINVVNFMDEVSMEKKEALDTKILMTAREIEDDLKEDMHIIQNIRPFNVKPFLIRWEKVAFNIDRSIRKILAPSFIPPQLFDSLYILPCQV